MPGKILIAVGSPTIRNVAESLLNKHGYEVFLADDGLKALGALKLEKPDVLFLDFSLPALSGDQVLEELKKNRDSNPEYVIMLLDKENEKNKRELESQGVSAFIIKPFSPKELLEKVKNLLESNQNSPNRDKQADVSSDNLRTSNNGLDILETSDLVEDYEQSIPDSQKTGVHGFDWFLSELQKEITEEDKTGSKPKRDAGNSEEKTAPQLEETFIKYQPTGPAAGEKPENNSPRFEGEAPENFIEDLRKELEEVGPVDENATNPEVTEMSLPVQLDQVLADIRSRISERVAQEVNKMISPELLERIIREEIVRYREQTSEKKSAVKEDIPS